MPLKEPWLLKTVIGTATPQIKADPGEAFMIKDIFIRDPVSDFITLTTEKTSVGYFRVKKTLGNHLAFRRGRAQHSHTIRIDDGSGVAVDHHARLRDGNSVNRKILLGKVDAPTGDVYDEVRSLLWSGFHHCDTILGLLAKIGVFKGFPVAEGETFQIAGMGGANSITLIIYEQWDPADIKPEQENGSRASEYFFLNYGNCGASVNVSGDSIYNTSITAAEFPDFPFGKVVPANHEIDLVGIAASPFAPGENEGSNYTYTSFLKLLKDREVLFDEDRNGILFLARSATADGAQDMKSEGFSLLGNYSELDNNPPLIFPTPLTFLAGDELNIYLTTIKVGSGQAIAIDEHEICLIEKVRRVTK